MQNPSWCLCVAVTVVLGGITGATEPTPAARQQPAPAAPHVPGWLSGVWRREWIEEHGSRSSLLDVYYLQTPSFFGDVRIPLDRPNLSHVSSFTDLSDQELHALAQEEGFAGPTTLVGNTATWHHEIDFQPPTGEEDVGRLEPLADRRMYEHGLDGSYTESWRFATDGAGRFLVVQTESNGRPQRLFLIAGDYFFYFRNRERDLPKAQSLDALIKSTDASRAQIIEYLNCEFAVGRVRGGAIPWEIQRSTLPWREGHRLEFADEIEVAGSGNGIRPRTSAGSERWAVPVNTLTRSELRRIFGSRAHR